MLLMNYNAILCVGTPCVRVDADLPCHMRFCTRLTFHWTRCLSKHAKTRRRKRRYSAGQDRRFEQGRQGLSDPPSVSGQCFIALGLSLRAGVSASVGAGPLAAARNHLSIALVRAQRVETHIIPHALSMVPSNKVRKSN